MSRNPFLAMLFFLALPLFGGCKPDAVSPVEAEVLETSMAPDEELVGDLLPPGGGRDLAGMLPRLGREIDLTGEQKRNIRNHIAAFRKEHRSDLEALHDLRVEARKARLDGDDFTKEEREAFLDRKGVDRDELRRDQKALRASIRSELTDEQIAKLMEKIQDDPPLEGMFHKRMERMGKAIDLTDAQRATIRDLVESFQSEHRTEIEALHDLRVTMRKSWLEGKDFDREDAEAFLQSKGVDREAFRAERKKLREAIHAVLTEEQVKKLREMREERGERRGKRMEGRRRGHRGL